MISANEGKDKMERKGKIRLAVRSLIGIVIMVYLALAYSLSYVAFDSPEYYISLITLVMNTCLFLGALIANGVLTRGIEKQTQFLKETAKNDKADPWKL